MHDDPDVLGWFIEHANELHIHTRKDANAADESAPKVLPCMYFCDVLLPILKMSNDQGCKGLWREFGTAGVGATPYLSTAEEIKNGVDALRHMQESLTTMVSGIQENLTTLVSVQGRDTTTFGGDAVADLLGGLGLGELDTMAA